ncbi:MAG: bifunctional homocysteine S-methyltransferase/methylenetetrahydrofolate reductase [Desulfurivibrionaceae bacterium]
MKADFIKTLEERVILGDGALGSYLYEKGVELGRNLDLLNLRNPELVFAAHEEYIRAGSQLIETNTFGANRFILGEAGADDKVTEINRLGAEVARKAAGHQAFVAGSVGPTGVRFPLDIGEISEEELRDGLREQLEGLAAGGVDLFILETFSRLDEIIIAIETARAVAPELPVVAQMVFPTRGKTQEGIDARICAEKMLAAGAAVVGSNCGRGIDAMVTAIKAMSAIGREDVALSAFPNAGLPEMVGHRMIYPAQPAYMAARAAEMLKLGVRLIGGCCGTTPAHIHEFRKTLNIKPMRQSRTGRAPATQTPRAAEHPPETDHGPGRFLAGLKEARIPILVELDPPTHLEITPVLAGAKALAEHGADAITLGENPLAILRTGNLGIARRIREETGIQTIIHQTGRDLNALGLQSRMMEAHILGIEAVLAVTGDSASATDQPGVSGIFDLDSFGLIRMLSLLNQGQNLAGQSIRVKTDFSIGAAFSFRPKNPTLQISRLEKKAALGARYALTQPLFSKDSVEQMMEKVSHIDMLIFPGIFPLISARNAEFLHHEVPGITVPDEIRSRLARYDKVEDQKKAALEISRQLVMDISTFVDGLYLISPLNKWDVTLEIVDQVRKAGCRGSGRHLVMAAS